MTLLCVLVGIGVLILAVIACVCVMIMWDVDRMSANQERIHKDTIRALYRTHG